MRNPELKGLTQRDIILIGELRAERQEHLKAAGCAEELRQHHLRRARGLRDKDIAEKFGCSEKHVKEIPPMGSA